MFFLSFRYQYMDGKLRWAYCGMVPPPCTGRNYCEFNASGFRPHSFDIVALVGMVSLLQWMIRATLNEEVYQEPVLLSTIVPDLPAPSGFTVSVYLI